ncbi:MAG TPA: RNA polymerase sigma-70 factor [Ktedonosporobacter sp.]|nr:RNA polymerase sigma-70 factor [Ktedonosporobacter sp.]
MESFETYRPLLFSIAYRMTGSASQAEDSVQDTYLRYQQADSSNLQSLKAFLTTIIVNLCLNYLKSAHVQREEYVGIWLPEPVLTSATESESPETTIERQESVSLAFLVLLEALTPPERAVFLLHEVFDYPFAEIAEILGKAPENCRQLFHRARSHLKGRPQRASVSKDHQRQLIHSFVSACQSGDLTSLKTLLAHDVMAWADGGGKVRAGLLPVSGQETVARLFITLTHKFSTGSGLFLDDLNGEPALFIWDESHLNSVLLFELENGTIKGLRTVMNPEKLAFLQRQLEKRKSLHPFDWLE